MNRQPSISNEISNVLKPFKAKLKTKMEIDDIEELCIQQVQALMVLNETELFNINRDLKSYNGCLTSLLAESKEKRLDEDYLNRKQLIKKSRHYITILRKQNEKKNIEKNKITEVNKACLIIAHDPSTFSQNIHSVNELCKDYSSLRRNLSKKFKRLEEAKNNMLPRLFEAEDDKDLETATKLSLSIKKIDLELSSTKDQYNSTFEKELMVRKIKVYLSKISKSQNR